MTTTCTHRDLIRYDSPTEADKAGASCEDCVRIGSRWVHLRMCLTMRWNVLLKWAESAKPA